MNVDIPSVRRSSRILVNVAAAALLGLAVVLGLTFAPTLAGQESLIVTSGSMGSAVPAGSVAITRAVDVRSVAVDDIVSYRHPGDRIPTTHRVVEVQAEGDARVFITKGDANEEVDVRPARISGDVHVVERVVPLVGGLIMFIRSGIGTVLFLLLPVLGLAFTRGGRLAERSPAPAREEPVGVGT